MAKTAKAEHPDGQDRLVVVDKRRGRWRCWDVWVNDANKASTDTAPEQGKSSDAEETGQQTETMLQTTQGVDKRQFEVSGQGEHDVDDKQTSSTLARGLHLQHHQSVSLDSNSNASPRRNKSRTTKADHTAELTSDVEDDPEEDWLTRTEILVAVLVVFIVLSPYLVLWWFSSVDSWDVMHILRRVLVQGMAVAFATGIVLLALQVHFSRFQLRQWVARVFQLEMRGQVRARVGNDSIHPVVKGHGQGRPGSNGDTQTDHASPEEQKVTCEAEAEAKVSTEQGTGSEEQTGTGSGQPVYVVNADAQEQTSTSAGQIVHAVGEANEEQTGATSTEHTNRVVNQAKTQTSASAEHVVYSQAKEQIDTRSGQVVHVTEGAKVQTNTGTAQTAPAVSQAKEQTSPLQSVHQEDSNNSTGLAVPVVGQAKEETHCNTEEQVTRAVTGSHAGHQNSVVNTKQVAKTTSQERRSKNAMKKMFRKFLLIRRKYKSEMSGLKRTDQEASEVLSRVQLALPVLEREKQALLAELEAIQKQHQEEKRRNHDLLARLHRLNQQFTRIGTPQASLTSTGQSQEPQHHQTDPYRPPTAHHHHHQLQQ